MPLVREVRDEGLAHSARPHPSTVCRAWGREVRVSVIVVTYGAAVVLSALASSCSVFILQTFEQEVAQSVEWTAVLVALAAVWGSISSAIGVGAHALVGELKPSLPSLVSLTCAGVATWLGSLVVLGAITGTVGGPWLVAGLVPAVATVLTLALAVAMRALTVVRDEEIQRENRDVG